MMRRKPVMFFVMLLLGGWMFGSSPLPAHACSCVVASPPETALRESSAVFSGIVLSVREPNNHRIRSSADPVEVTFRVTEIWKGVDTDRLTVRTAASTASCGFEFALGQHYIVYAQDTPNGLATGLCTRTAELAAASDDLKALGKGTVPPPSPELEERIRSNPAGLYLFWTGMAFAVLAAAALALLILRLRRRH
jgi:hypothetical protein